MRGGGSPPASARGQAAISLGSPLQYSLECSQMGIYAHVNLHSIKIQNGLISLFVKIYPSFMAFPSFILLADLLC